ncbi:MAG: biotin--[acetyl-CoA-carboxylase] ligase [Chlamydiae bacterium]|nr:biotin--[acetyl-CoA-carboxylase] ligase [Chlamydiota bacterium]
MSLDQPITFHHYDSLTSTNDWIKKNYALYDLDRLHLLSASQQTQGRGTYGKSWFSPEGLNLYASFFFALDTLPFPFTHIAQLLSLSSATTLESLGFTPKLKWPNDLLIENKKIAGVLCELVTIPGKTLIVLGLGLNVNMPLKLCLSLDQPATSLAVISKRSWELEPLRQRLAEEFQQDLLLYLEKDFVPFYKAYTDRKL